jgi:acetyl esterase
MAYVVKLPQLGLEMEEGTILEWYVEEGGAIEEGEVLLEVESEKSIGEVEAREDGVLRVLAIGEGETVPPGTPIGIVADPEEDVADLETQFDSRTGDDEGSEERDETPADAEPGARDGTEGTSPPSAGSSGSEVRASPRAKRRAEEVDVDLTAVDGTGPQGAITAEDVDNAVESAATLPDEAADEDGTSSDESELHSQAEDLLHDLSAAGVPPLYRQSVEEARATYRDLCIPDTEPETVRTVVDGAIPGPGEEVPIRVYDPGRGDSAAGDPDAAEASDAQEGRPALLFFHGGGWMAGDLATHDETCRALANRVGEIVVSVEYRRAPEHPFPAALEDCYAVADWASSEPDLDALDPELAGIGIDPERIAVGGDSAGGTLAAGVALLARDRAGVEPCHQLLVYPATDHRFDTASYTENANGYFITRDDLERFWNEYLEVDPDGTHPYASPLRASTLEELPPATVLTCGFDPLRDDGIAYADRLAEAGVDVTHLMCDDMIHGFLTMLADPEWERAREAIADLGAELDRAFEA